MNTVRATLAKLIIIGGLSGLLGAWLLAIELAAIQGARALQPRWIMVAPWDPEIRPFTLAITLAAAFLSLVWYQREVNRIRPHRVSWRWYLKTVGWGVLCACLSIALAFVPALIRGVVEMPASFLAIPLQLVTWGMYGLIFGFPIVLVLSPIVVWAAEQAVLRSR